MPLVEFQFREPVTAKSNETTTSQTKEVPVQNTAKSDLNRPSDYRRLSLAIQKETDKRIIYDQNVEELSVHSSEKIYASTPTKLELISDLNAFIVTLDWYFNFQFVMLCAIFFNL